MRVKQLLNDEDFLKLMPLVVAFSLKTGMPIHQHMKEVAESIVNPIYLTQVGEVEDKPVRYLCGYHLNQVDFMVTQAFSTDNPANSMLAYKVFEDELYKRGVKKLLMMTHLHPRVFKRYGFRFERFLLSKELP